MKKLMNQPEHFVKETMEGIIAAYGDKVRLLNGDYRILLSNYETRPGKVGIVTAGGSGHLPVFLGYVGQGLLDGCTVGNVFASPSAAKMADMIRACDRGNGVLVLFGNYGGDRMNFELACETVDMEDDIRTEMVLVKDDVASAPACEKDRRRGVAGMVYAFKVAGAAAENGKTLEEVAAAARHALENIRTMGVALSSCTVPQVGETPLEEQLIVYRRVHALLTQMGVRIFIPHIGEYATSMEMAGLSLTIMKLDGELKGLLSQTARSPFYTNYNK